MIVTTNIKRISVLALKLLRQEQQTRRTMILILQSVLNIFKTLFSIDFSQWNIIHLGLI